MVLSSAKYKRHNNESGKNVCNCVVVDVKLVHFVVSQKGVIKNVVTQFFNNF